MTKNISRAQQAVKKQKINNFFSMLVIFLRHFAMELQKYFIELSRLSFASSLRGRRRSQEVFGS
jgi:hypothetical protein